MTNLTASSNLMFNGSFSNWLKSNSSNLLTSFSSIISFCEISKASSIALFPNSFLMPLESVLYVKKDNAAIEQIQIIGSTMKIFVKQFFPLRQVDFIIILLFLSHDSIDSIMHSNLKTVKLASQPCIFY
ncbi:hypothetical protein SDC9_129451 [bioreactor metagenome]|uniref:Uncharacterized protein n=1 Tax=bioreactor metagenome TaxID=1076179 RepID=A0A645CYV6_9ZZZZ